MQEKKVVNLLWTGGWDSTFRLLSLINNKQVRICLYYIIDKSRHSLEAELQAMDSILAAIYLRFDGAKDRILSVTHFVSDQIHADLNITAKYEQLLEISPLGSQYPLLAMYAQMHGYDDLEMCVASTDSWTSRHLRDVCERVEDPVIGEYRRIKYDIEDDAPISLFRYFIFPTLHITKVDMLHIAKENGFYDILNMSWFCHTPYNNKPCGMCKPCKLAITEGMAFRLPLGARIRNKMPIVFTALLKVRKVGFIRSIKLIAQKFTQKLYMAKQDDGIQNTHTKNN